jgi:hypothetical protein
MKQYKLIHKFLSLTFCAALVYFIFAGLISNVSASQLSHRSLQIGDSTASSVTNYNFTFNLISSSTLGSISFQFCSNDAIIGDSCTAPSGFNDTNTSIATQSGQAGFSVSNASTANDLIIARTPSPASATQVNYIFSNITNPSSSGAYFVRIETYASNNATGSYVDYGGIAYSISSAINISALVPPYLLFCTGLSIPADNCDNATGDFINFGNLSSSGALSDSSQMLAASNARSGYDITIYGTTLQSGNNVINGLSSPDVSRPGVSQFGINLRANSSPGGGQDPSGPGGGSPTPNYNQPNFFSFNSGDVVASTTGPDTDRLYTDDYLVNVNATQAPGVYDTTLTYICVATF